MKTFEITFMWVVDFDRHIERVEVEAEDYFDAVKKAREKTGRWIEEASREFKVIETTPMKPRTKQHEQ